MRFTNISFPLSSAVIRDYSKEYETIMQKIFSAFSKKINVKISSHFLTALSKLIEMLKGFHCLFSFCFIHFHSGIYNFLPLLSSQCFIFILFIALSGECNLLDSVSSQQKFEAMDIKALGKSQLSDSLCYSSQTDQFI